MPRIVLATPAAFGSRVGNRVTALRWAGILRSLGVRVGFFDGRRGFAGADLLVALHARKSGEAVRRFSAECGGRPIVVVITGTDLDVDLSRDPASVLGSLARADRIVVLEPSARARLPAEFRERVRVVLQSARCPSPRPAPLSDRFEVCVLAHLRDVKDPLLAARAVRLLPADTRIRVVHAGTALDDELAARARAAAAADARWSWLGPLPRREALRLAARARLLLVTSRSEGAASAISEAIACGTPVLATRVHGSVGLLGMDYPGWYPPGDVVGLAVQLRRAEREPEFVAELREAVGVRRAAFEPEREREAWRSLLVELGVR